MMGEIVEPKYPNVFVQLVGRNGSTGVIMARVTKAMQDSLPDDASQEMKDDMKQGIHEFRTAVFDCPSYEAFLRLVAETVSVGQPEDYE